MSSPMKRGLVYGLLATLGMTAVMFLGLGVGLSPMPSPIPIALAHLILGDLPGPALRIIGMIAHFLYGGVAGALLFTVRRGRVDVPWGLAFGAVLWLGMQVVVLPLLGWGAIRQRRHPSYCRGHPGAPPGLRCHPGLGRQP